MIALKDYTLNKGLRPTIRGISLMLLGIFQRKHSILPLRITIVSCLQAKKLKEVKALQKNWF